MIKKYIKNKLQKYSSPWIVLVIDMILVLGSYIIAAFIKYAFLLSIYFYNTIYQLPLIFLVFLLVFIITKSYRGVIRYTNIKDMSRISIALFIALLILLSADLLLNQYYYNTRYDVKRSTLLIHFFLNVNILVFSRLCFAHMYNRIMQTSEVRSNVIIYGAGEMGMAVNNLFTNEKDINVVAFIDDNLYKTRKRINNITIIYSKKISKKYIKKRNIKEVYIAINNISKNKIKSISEQYLGFGVKPKLIPSSQKWVDGILDAKQIKGVKIEDLLARDAIQLNTELWNESLTNKTILVTGGAGSIGSEIVRQLFKFKVKQILILDQSESSLYNMQQELIRNNFNNFTVILDDVCNINSIEIIFKKYKPTIIFHAAAYKHVPLMETFPKQSIKVNLGGTKVISDLAIKYAVERFVMISTDKAVNPTNVMGASKRAAEIYIGLIASADVKTKFITTRFGNVLGSNGSVIPLFRKQIEEGGPLTVTHKDIIRYFMTILEASQLVIEAGITGKGGEIFVFDMGKPIKIYDLALNMIQLSGFKYPKDINIKITGLRPGEKLFEELLQNSEDNLPTHHKKIQIAKASTGYKTTNINLFNELIKKIELKSNIEIVAILKKIVPEYKSKNSKYQELD